MSTKYPPPDTNRYNALSQLYAKGYTLRRAARILGKSDRTISRTIYGITKNQKLLTQINNLPPRRFLPLKYNRQSGK